MADIEKKLADFSNVILSEAQDKKEEKISQLEKIKSKAVHESENEILEDAYEKIQKAVIKHSKEQNERILKHDMAAKKQVIKKREDIITSVFAEVEARLAEFVNSSEYEPWLVALAKKACDEVGTDEIQICERDLKYKAALEKALPDVKITARTDDIIGGLSATCKNLSVNYIIKDMLAEKRSEFLKTSGLNIRA